MSERPKNLALSMNRSAGKALMAATLEPENPKPVLEISLMEGQTELRQRYLQVRLFGKCSSPPVRCVDELYLDECQDC